ncbi:hypothetical protein EYF80_053935 [Liparis tanakae]|uniref:Uncharacterized protein n=1 Tax=Liparis tanakae TaxID=230148 RepID=A0A4Z2F4S6_9TELE|nr:hypothetical protein EYF80_053935 [Liparis tanakae]
MGNIGWRSHASSEHYDCSLQGDPDEDTEKVLIWAAQVFGWTQPEEAARQGHILPSRAASRPYRLQSAWTETRASFSLLVKMLRSSSS